MKLVREIEEIQYDTLHLGFPRITVETVGERYRRQKILRTDKFLVVFLDLFDLLLVLFEEHDGCSLSQDSGS